MGVTSRGIAFPEDVNAVAPLDGYFAALAQSVDDALATLQSATTPNAANEAQRQSLYPTPVQGNRVYRLDKGFYEVFYESYSPLTNPGGATPAGWYPAPGSDIRFSVSKDNFSMAANGSAQYPLAGNPAPARNDGYALASDGTITPPYIGDYEVVLRANWNTQNSAGQRNLGMDYNGTMIGGGGSQNRAPGPMLGGEASNGLWHWRSPAAAGGFVRPYTVQNSGAVLSVTMYAMFRYMGPSKY